MGKLIGINPESIVGIQRYDDPPESEMVECWRCNVPYARGHFDQHLRTTPTHPKTWSEKLAGPYGPLP